MSTTLTRDQIRAIFLANGFTIKEGCDDLKPYVYAAADALLAAAPARLAGATQGEAVATLHDDGCFTWKRDEFRRKYDRQRAGWRMDVYAHPQAPAATQPEPGAAQATKPAAYKHLKTGELFAVGEAEFLYPSDHERCMAGIIPLVPAGPVAVAAEDARPVTPCVSVQVGSHLVEWRPWSFQHATQHPAPAVAEPTTQGDWVTEFCAKYSGEDVVKAGDVLDFLMHLPSTCFRAAPAVAAEAGRGERARFEAAWRQTRGIPMNTRRHDDGRYGDYGIERDWVLWQAALATQPAQPLSEEQQRERFEAFHAYRKQKGATRRERMIARLPDGTYVDESVQRHWWTWQNALATKKGTP